MQASLSLALSLCLGCAVTVPWSGSLRRLPDLHARVLVAGAGAVAAATQARTAAVASIAVQALHDAPGVMDPTATVSDEEVQAWQDLLEGAAPGTALPVITAQAWPAWTMSGADAGMAGARWADARRP